MTEVRSDDDGHDDPMAGLREVMGNAAEMAMMEEEIKGVIDLAYVAIRGVYSRMANDDVLIADIASFSWKCFTALKEAGFDSDSALAIVISCKETLSKVGKQ